jgi:hypothetical protein
MSLSLIAQPGFAELPDADFDAGGVASDTNMKALNAAAKFGVVRNEQFWGYYRNGEQVVLPVSPADGYQYSRSELVYTWSVFATQPAVTALLGTQSTPTAGSNSGAGTILLAQYQVNQSSGNVSCITWYFNGSATAVTADGILLVMAFAQRQR